VWAHIPWRRRDAEPERKNVIVVEGRSGGRVSNVLPLDLKQSEGDILFQAPEAGTYFVYYMPYTSKGRNYPW